MKKTLTALIAASLLLAGCDAAEQPEQPLSASVAVAASAAFKPAASANHQWGSDAAVLCERQNGVWAALYQAVPDPDLCFTETNLADTEQLAACFRQQGQQLQVALPEQWRHHVGPVQTDFQTDQYGNDTLRYLLPVKNGMLHGVPVQAVMVDVNLEETDTFGSIEPVLQLSGSLKEVQTALQDKLPVAEKFYIDNEKTEFAEEFDSLDAALQSSENLAASDVYSRRWQPQPMQNNADRSVELLCLPVGEE